MKRILTCIALFTLTTTTIFSQSINNYTTNRTTGITFNSILGTGNSVATWRNTAQFSQDDNRSIPIDMGFDFWYNGIRYNQFSVSTNGFIDFSSSTANGTGTGVYGYSNTRFSNASPTGIALAPLYDDMTAQGGDEALGNSIKYLTTGSAPNRVLTIEWINMAVYNNTSPDINFQVVLYESSGLIEFVYGTITPGTASYSYTLGINAATISNPPTTSQLLTQQSPNSNTFSNSAANSLSTLPASNSKISFTSQNHTGTFNGTLSFTSVTSSGMTVNYNNWCTNEVGYAIYVSTNNVDFSFVSQNAANSTSYAATGLSPNTTYYWKVFALTEGRLSNAASGNQSTSAAGTKTSNVTTGNWSTNGSWTPSGVPTATDNVIIKNGHTITINGNAQCNNLTVGQGSSGTLRLGNNGTSRILTVNGNVTINNGATLISGTSNATHTATISGNIINNGTLNFRPTSSRVVNVTFDGSTDQLISGTGSTTAFNTIIQNTGTNISNTLSITSSNFTAPDQFLTLNNGTFKLSSTNALSIALFSSDYTLAINTGFHLNNPNATINFNGNLLLNGNLTVQAGTINIGDAVDEYLESKGGAVLVSGGNLNIASRYFSTNINTLSDFTMNGGTLTVPFVGSSNSTQYPFHIDATGSTFNMSGGSLILQSEGGSGSENLGLYLDGLAFNNISGGTIQFGNNATPSDQNFKVFSTSSLPNLLVHNMHSTVTLMNPVEIAGDISITGGTLDANSQNLSIGGNWNNTGSFIEESSTVTFNGTSNQSISAISGEDFYNLTINKSAGSINVIDTITLHETLDLQNGTLNTNNKVVLHSDASGTSRIAAITSAVISGDVIAQRFMPGGENKRKWRYMSSPVNVGGNISLSQFIDDIYISGNGGASNGFDESPTNTPSLRAYDESISGNVDQGWVAPSSINSTYPTGSGFEVFGRGSRATVNPFDVFTTPLDATIDLIGNINQGNISTNLSYTNNADPSADGFNLIGNPYPSQIDFNSVGITKTNMENRFWVYNPNSGSYGVFDGELNVGTNGISRYISSSQGFFVKANAPGASISFTENAKSTVSPFIYFRSQKNIANSLNILQLKVVRDSLISDELLIAFKENASITDEDPSDAEKFFNDQLNFYSKSSNGKNLAINAFPFSMLADTINLSLFAYNGTSDPWTGLYTMYYNADSIYALNLVLEDRYEGKLIPLQQNGSFTFNITNDPLSIGNERFKLLINTNITSTEHTLVQKQAVVMFPNPVKNKLTLRLNKILKDKNCRVTLYNQSGKMMHTDSYSIDESEVSVSVEDLDPGIYMIILDKDSGEWSGKFNKE